MYCNQCGFRNPDDVPNCYKCGAAMGPSQPSPPSPPTPGFTLPPPGSQPPPQPPPFTPPQPPYTPPAPGYPTQPPPYRTTPPPYGGPPAGSVPNHLVMAILVTIFCCLPFGIVAIVYAAQVNGKLQSGDYAGAQEASKKAKTFSWVPSAVG